MSQHEIGFDAVTYERLFDMGNTTKALGLGFTALGVGGLFVGLMTPNLTFLVIPSLILGGGGIATTVAGQNVQDSASRELERLRLKQAESAKAPVQTAPQNQVAVISGRPPFGAYW